MKVSWTRSSASGAVAAEGEGRGVEPVDMAEGGIGVEPHVGSGRRGVGRWRAGLGAQWGEQNYPGASLRPSYGAFTAAIRRLTGDGSCAPARRVRRSSRQYRGAAITLGRGVPGPGHDRGRRPGAHAVAAGRQGARDPRAAADRRGRTVPADALLDAGWDDVPREVAARSLAVRVANLRAYLEPGRERGAPSSLLVREGPGYRLAVEPSQVDAHRFERAVRAAASLPPADALEALERALALWRGPGYGDLAAASSPRRGAPARGPPRAGAGRARPRARRARPAARGDPRPAPSARGRAARGGADPHADARPVRRRPAGRGARRLPRARRAAARARPAAGRAGARARAPHPRAGPGPGGAAEPAPAVRVPARPGPVGREHELGRLRAALPARRRGRRTGVLLHGEAGAGKSALVDAFLAEAVPGGAVAGVGQCVGHRGPGEPYMPVLEALGELAAGPRPRRCRAALAQRAPTWLVELPWLLDEAPTPRRCATAPRAPPLADAARDARGAGRDQRRRARAARARGPPLGRRLHPRPARRGAAPPRPRAACWCSAPPARGEQAAPRSPRSPTTSASAACGVASRRAAARGGGRRVPAAPLPGRPAARRAGRRARAPRGRQPAVHAQPRRALARRGRARPRRRRRAAPARRGALEEGVPPTCTPTSATSSTRSHPTTRSCCRPRASPAAASPSPRSPPPRAATPTPSSCAAPSSRAVRG